LKIKFIYRHNNVLSSYDYRLPPPLHEICCASQALTSTFDNSPSLTASAHLLCWIAQARSSASSWLVNVFPLTWKGRSGSPVMVMAGTPMPPIAVAVPVAGGPVDVDVLAIVVSFAGTAVNESDACGTGTAASTFRRGRSAAGVGAGIFATLARNLCFV
jgi:hypothetical protein